MSGAGVVLGIETSCDDTCAAVVTPRRRDPLEHHLLAGRARPLRRRRPGDRLAPAPRADGGGRRGRAARRRASTIDELGAVAVTAGPGLVGALLVGVASAKAIAASRGLPLIAVDHLQGHVAANFAAPDPFEPPFVCLIASGGHTFLARVEDRHGFEVLGATLDDAAGEAFDKGARMLGLPFPGGPHLQRLAAGRRPARRSTSRAPPGFPGSTSASPG